MNQTTEQAKYSSASPAETRAAVLLLLKNRYPYMVGPQLECTDPKARLVVSANHRGVSLIVQAEAEDDLESMKAVATEVLSEATNQNNIQLEWDRA